MAEILNNRYQVIRALGSGGFGETFLAEDLNMPTRRRCVVKKLKLTMDEPETLDIIKDRFQREAAILEMLGHHNPQIPDLYAYFVEQDNFYLVQEYIEGQTLSEKLRQHGPFSQLEVRQLLIDLLPVLDYIHGKSIIHRDLKPDNIILQKDGKPVLIDFGAVKEAVNTVLYQPGHAGSIVIGTPGYLPPEQAAGRPIFASDLYSLGMTAIHLLTGKSPRELETNPRTGEAEWQKYVAPAVADIRHTMISIDPQLAAVLSKAIQTYPRDRYNSATEMLAALQATTPLSFPNSPTPGSSGTVAEPRPIFPAETVVSPPPNSPASRPPAATPARPSTGQADNSTEHTRAVLPNAGQSGARQSDAGQSVSQPTAIVSGGARNSRGGGNSSYGDTDQGDSGSAGWLKPVLIGGAIGFCLLGGALAVQFVQNQSVSTPETSPTTPVATSPTGSPDGNSEQGSSPTTTPSPVASDPSPTESPATDLPCGDPPGSGDVWYPVFVNNGDLSEIRRKYCRDAFASKREDGTPTVQVASFTSEERAAEFAQTVGGEVGKPRDIPHSESTSSPSPSPSAAPEGSSEENVNATIIGESGSKNIRSGPGTSFSVTTTVNPGDRVQILGSAKDAGGFIWYRIFVPESNRQGWIASQLIKPD
jgi:serine/threonine protein kinase, bacterial